MGFNLNNNMSCGDATKAYTQFLFVAIEKCDRGNGNGNGIDNDGNGGGIHIHANTSKWNR